jgi:hypothetical protein
MHRRYRPHARSRRPRARREFNPAALLARLVSLLPASERDAQLTQVVVRCIEELFRAYDRKAVAGIVQTASGRVVGHVSVITESRQAAIVAMTAILHELSKKEGEA